MLNATRRAAIAAGTWEYQVPAGPLAEHCRRLRETNGLSYHDQAKRSGLAYSHLRNICNGKIAHVSPDTARAVLALTADPNPLYLANGLLDGVGVRRRLRGLAADDWPFQPVAQRLGVTHQQIGLWAAAEHVTSATHDKVAALTEELWGTPGPGRYSGIRARRRGWVGLDAWGDRIDDPDATPQIPDPDAYVDDVKVWRATRGECPAVDLTRDERVAALRILARRYLTDHEIAEAMQWTTRTGRNAHAAVLAWRRRHGIEAGYRTGRSAPGDPERVAAALAGDVAAGELHPAERRAAVLALVEQGFSDREISVRLRWNTDPDRGAGAVQTFRGNQGITSGRKCARNHPTESVDLTGSS